MKAGTVAATGRALDVAAEGDAMFAVQSPDGEEAYTRRGDFQLSASGLLTTGDGHPVLGSDGPVLPPPADSIAIDGEGRIDTQGTLTTTGNTLDMSIQGDGYFQVLMPDGLRIDLVDDADFSMFVGGTDALTPNALALLREVGRAARDLPNGITIRGHTDAAVWTRDPAMNNWRLSVARAEATRRMLVFQQIQPYRIVRIEGVANREPYVPANPLSPSNRRISVTLTWRDAPPS